MPNTLLNKAKRHKQDEFYTQLSDIENELEHYTEHFNGKTVLCNCDDPRTSNFFRYFMDNFESLKLKKLVTTCYKSRQESLFCKSESGRATYLEYDGCNVEIRYLDGDGDFRSQECIGLLKQSDIVVTNPPFSLFREYVAQLVKFDKKFIIIGNVNGINYKEIFPLMKNNKLWLGVSIHSGGREFGVPAHYDLKTTNSRIDENGNKFVIVPGIRWFTNIDHKDRHRHMVLHKKYSNAEYPKYDNYDAINVDKTKDIPMDYDGTMGVPITFLDKHNPDQFEILGESIYRPALNGRTLYARILIRRKN